MNTRNMIEELAIVELEQRVEFGCCGGGGGGGDIDTGCHRINDSCDEP